MTPDIEDLRPSILFQIATAFAKLGSPLDREQLEGMTPAEIYAAAEASGAGIELLSTIGRWGDTLDESRASPPARLEPIRRTWDD